MLIVWHSGETDRMCALRETDEETGIHEDAIKIDRHFSFTHSYTAVYAWLSLLFKNPHPVYD